MKTDAQIRDAIARLERERDYWRNEETIRNASASYFDTCRVSALICVERIEALKWVLG